MQEKDRIRNTGENTSEITQKEAQNLLEENKLLKEQIRLFQEQETLKNTETFRLYLLNNLVNINSTLKDIGQVLTNIGKVMDDKEGIAKEVREEIEADEKLEEQEEDEDDDDGDDGEEMKQKIKDSLKMKKRPSFSEMYKK